MRYTAKDFSAISKKDRTALRCDLCGAPVSFYSKEYPAFNLSGKHICEACYKKEMETATFTCKDCRKIFLKRIGKSDYCPDCWKKQLGTMRLEKAPYRIQLEDALRAHGYTPNPVAQDMLDAYGNPAIDVPQEYIGGVTPLRLDPQGVYNGSERGIYAVRARDAVIAYPDNSIGLRFLIPSEDLSFMKKIDQQVEKLRSHSFFAIAGDANDLYILDVHGRVISVQTGEVIFLLFDEEEEIRKIIAQIPKEALAEQVAHFLSGEHPIGSTPLNTYYDGDRQMFYCTGTDGNSHEGIYEFYVHISKDEVVAALKKKVDLSYVRMLADRGLFPEYLVAEALPQAENWDKLPLPDDKLVY